MNYDIYCLSFNGTERDNRMKARFRSLGLDSVTYFEPISLQDPKLDYYLEGSSIKREWRISSIVVSFLEMFKLFLKSDKEYGIFCQDDIYIRKTFVADLDKILKFLNKNEIDHKLLLLGYLLPYSPESYHCKQIYKVTDQYSIYNYHDELWGSQMFVLTRQAAMELVEKYDRPFIQNSDIIADDHTFTKIQPRLMVYKMLACEEGTINCDHQGQKMFHFQCKNFNYDPNEFI